MNNNNVIKIALTGVLSYLIFKKIYNCFTTLLLWMNVEIRLDNNFLLIALNVLCGIFSFIVLIFIYNRFLKNRIPLKPEVIFLLCTTIFIHLIDVFINWLYAKYLIQIRMTDYRAEYLFQFSWSKIIDTFLPVLVLVYFLWIIYQDNKNINSKKLT